MIKFYYSAPNQVVKSLLENLGVNKYYQFQRISVISSYFASLFLGDYASIDYGDGSAMNLLDLKTREWSSKCLAVSNANL